MKKKYQLITALIVLILIFSSAYFVDIPSPSKLISEDYQLEIK